MSVTPKVMMPAAGGAKNVAGAQQMSGRYNLSVGGPKGVERLMAERLQTTNDQMKLF